MVNKRIITSIRYAGVVTGLLVAGMAIYLALHDESQQLTVEYVTIPIRGLPEAFDGFQILQLSDFHLYPLTRLELVQRAVQMGNELSPDLIVLTGDYVWHEVDAVHDLVPVLAELHAPYGVYGIMGNHEWWTDAAVVQAAFDRQGLPLLINQGVALQRGEQQIYLAGLDDGWSGNPNLDVALAGAPPGAPVILLYHEPDLADEIARDGRVAVQLAGHSHGGQVRFKHKRPLVLPYLAWKYPSGLYRVGDLWLYTNRGIGVTNIPWRYNCSPELTLITLRRE